jgi:hypothetical protein
MTTQTGGPAFPAHENWRIDSGMTLRDYFAAKIIQGMMASGNLPKSVTDKELAAVSYATADAMLNERMK